MSKKKHAVLYVLAILFALVISFDLNMRFLDRAFLLGFIVLLMVLFMVVFTKQEEAKKTREEEKKKASIDIVEEVDSNRKKCVYCDTLNPVHATYCKKCKRSMDNIVCPVCGHVNSYKDKYCEECDSILQNKKVHL